MEHDTSNHAIIWAKLSGGLFDTAQVRRRARVLLAQHVFAL